mmetsp:Transcript_39064/g.91937  ORF Transcript_39064/g.91937 Transcript_39064/m.91937 type:complete len:224 (-) Transcript_39064:87-758(-)|eukprot:CAMPEP_0178437854 /NCGR_PEP_ID=MMETSP0689_2-20121128/35238_1 /TAXON_ID=160604 /ORGANISM="Amphidinium massartii, Strain CS-259" /LENGTH=223 /DNA_ID=CAMNT_0020060131 /DNA_START=23 /DNA_END=694 /DNA_ORIENTATION=-
MVVMAAAAEPHIVFALPPEVRLQVLEYMQSGYETLNKVETAKVALYADQDSPEVVRSITNEMEEALMAAHVGMLQQRAEGSWLRGGPQPTGDPASGAQSASQSNANEVMRFLEERNTTRLFWLDCLAPDQKGAEEAFLQSGQQLASVASQAMKASKAAWRLRKWDLYERPREAPQLKDRHPALLEAAEEVCTLAQRLRSGSLSSVSRFAQELTALAAGIAARA